MDDFGDFFDMVKEHSGDVTESKPIRTYGDGLADDVCDFIESMPTVDFRPNKFKKKVEEAMEESDIETNIINFVGKGLGETKLGYWYSGKRKDNDGMVYEFSSTDAPNIEVKVLDE